MREIMSRLEELIQNLCPDGVEYKPLEQCCEILDKKRKPITKSARVAGEYPYYGANGIQDYVSDYIFDGTFVLVGEDGSVITDKGTPVVNWATGKIWVNNHAHIITEKDGVILRYLYHYLQIVNVSTYIHGNIPKLTGGDFKALIIPVPPLEVQYEIVRILDNFTELTAELKDELSKRKEQFEAVSTHLFDEVKQSGDVYFLSDVCKIEKGKTPIQKANPGQYPLVVTTTERKSNSTFQFDSEAVCIPLVSSRGHGVASLNHVYYQAGKFALGNILCAVIPKDNSFVSAKYLYYYFEETKDYTLVPLMKGGANVALHISDIEKIKVPIPSKEKQELIIDYLTSFDNYCNIELPAEIEARQKQYEYYRDKILSFERR